MSESRYISITNKIISTLSSSIGFIQLNYDQKEIDFDKIINQRFKNVKTLAKCFSKITIA